MLEHQKIVLKGVSNNKYLFKKELTKSLIWLSSQEIYQLKKWVVENYSHIHKEIINEVLFSVSKVA